jgi:DNA-binding transcriptional LysR family regulator
MSLNLNQLRHLLALDRHRNFARAAEELGLTQPALTRSLQMLERIVGARLFDRDRSHVEPTAVGARLIEHARPLLDQAREVEQDIQQLLGLEVGLLRIGSGAFPAEISVGTAMGRLLRRHPHLIVDVSVGDWPVILPRVVSGDLDLAIIETSVALDDDRLVVEPLPAHRGVFFCRPEHPLVGIDPLTIDDIRRYPIALSALPSRLKFLSVGEKGAPGEQLANGSTVPQVRAEAPSLARAMVMESDALSVQLPRQIAHDVALGRLVELPIELPGMETRYGIIRRAGRSVSPAAAAFIQILREVETELT